MGLGHTAEFPFDADDEHVPARDGSDFDGLNSEPVERGQEIVPKAEQRIAELETEVIAEKRKVVEGKRLLRDQMRLTNERTAECIRLREQLAAAQATIAEKNEALNYAAAAFRELAQENDGDYETAEQMEAAAAIPINQDALHEALARECERLANSAGDVFAKHWLLSEASCHRARKVKA